MKYTIQIDSILKFYDITREGLVYSRTKKRWLKPQINNCGYVYYYIHLGIDYPRFIAAHQLVMYRYGTPCPGKHYEIHHKDENRTNNLFDNLEWVTHSQNQLKAYENGRVSYWLGKHRPTPELQTRLLMSNAKKKRVQYKSESQLVIYESIEDAASQLQTYRKRIYLCIKDNRPIKGGCLSFVPDLMEG